jgi:hypothetical protein
MLYTYKFSLFFAIILFLFENTYYYNFSIFSYSINSSPLTPRGLDPPAFIAIDKNRIA